MRRLGHPSLRKLHRWIDGTDDRLDRHLATCVYCADRLEAMLDDSEASIGDALRRLLTVPDELPDLLRAGIDARLSDQRDLMLITEFLGLPLRTVRVITTTDQGDD